MLKYHELVLNKYYRINSNGAFFINPKNYYFIYDKTNIIYMVNHIDTFVSNEIITNEDLRFCEVCFDEIKGFLPNKHPHLRKHKIELLLAL